jgi:hypothetical protein
MRCARVVHGLCRICGPLAAETTRGGYGRYCTNQPVPDNLASYRERTDATWGASDRHQQFVAMFFSLNPEWRGKLMLGGDLRRE